MHSHPVRTFRLSPPGKGRGVSCDASGAFIDSVPLLKRTTANGKDVWAPRDGAELSDALSKRFDLPIDISSRAKGLAAIARALNEGAVARAQLAALFLRFPDPPPLTKSASSRNERIRFIRELHAGGLLKWDADLHPRWPAGAPDSQGGQFAPRGQGGGQLFVQSRQDAPSRPPARTIQVADIEPEPDEEVEPAINGQTAAESLRASEIDNAAGEALSREQAAEEAGEDTPRTSQSRINRGIARREREDFWEKEAGKAPKDRILPPDIYTDENLARMKEGNAPIGEDGFPIELHHPDGEPWMPVEPMTRTDHRLGPNYLLNHPWLRPATKMANIYLDQVDLRGKFAGVFETDDNVGWFYLYVLDGDPGRRIAGAVQVCSGIPDFSLSDVDIRWYAGDTRVGLFIRAKLYAYFDLHSGRGFVGRYPNDPLN